VTLKANNDPADVAALLTELKRSILVLRRRGVLKLPCTPQAHPSGLAPSSSLSSSNLGPSSGIPSGGIPHTPSDLGQAPSNLPPMTPPPPQAIPDATPPIPSEGTKAERLAAYYQLVGECQRCPLAKGRKNIVHSCGNPDSGIMLIGEGPGRDEDLQGIPFVGRSGQLLTKMLAAAGIDRDKDIFITNIVKCRPPQNRDPAPEETKACRFLLRAQFSIVQPSLIIISGLQAAKSFFGPDITLSKMRNKEVTVGKCRAIVTYHPSFLLRQPAKKGEAWRDLIAIRQAMADLGLAPPPPEPWWLP